MSESSKPESAKKYRFHAVGPLTPKPVRKRRKKNLTAKIQELCDRKHLLTGEVRKLCDRRALLAALSPLYPDYQAGAEREILEIDEKLGQFISAGTLGPLTPIIRPTRRERKRNAQWKRVLAEAVSLVVWPEVRDDCFKVILKLAEDANPIETDHDLDLLEREIEEINDKVGRSCRGGGTENCAR